MDEVKPRLLLLRPPRAIVCHRRADALLARSTAGLRCSGEARRAEAALFGADAILATLLAPPGADLGRCYLCTWLLIICSLPVLGSLAAKVFVATVAIAVRLSALAGCKAGKARVLVGVGAGVLIDVMSAVAAVLGHHTSSS